MKSFVVLAAASVALTGCASFNAMFAQPGYAGGGETKLVQATPAPPPVIEALELPTINPPPGQSRPLPTRVSHAPRDPIADVRAANSKATQRPTSQQFVEAIQVYDYLPGAIYHVFTTPLHVTSIALRPGETMTKPPAAGDTYRWAIGEATAGTAPKQQQLIYVKPLKPGLSTNMIITTNERVYMIELESVDREEGKQPVYNAAIAWNYPLLEMEQIKAEAKSFAKQEEQTIAPAVDPTTLNTDYSIRTAQGSEPPWKPLRAFDDGKKTWLEFPANLGSVEAPPLFIVTPQDSLALVQFRIKGRYYVIDQIFNRAELRLGQEPQTIVRITNNKPPTAAQTNPSPFTLENAARTR